MNLQKEGMLKLSLYAFLLWPNQCHVFATTLTKVLVERKQMENQHLVCNGLPLVCLWKKNPLKLMSMLAKWPLCFFYISHCVSGVRWWSWNFISCGLILEVQDNLRCRNSSFSHFIMFWLKTFYIHFSQFVWCSCTQFKINACLKRYRLLLCGSCSTNPCKINQYKCTPKYLYLHFKEKQWLKMTKGLY